MGGQEVTQNAALRSAAEKARVKAGFFFAALGAVLALGGCVSLPQSDALRAAPPADLPPKIELTEVPFVPQDKDFLCGPAALATVVSYAGVPADLDSMTPLVYLPGRHGSLQAEMLGATRRTGLVAYSLPPQLEAVLREVAAGTPVVVLVNLTIRMLPVWHYAVVIGYDLERERVIVRTGPIKRDELRISFFEFLWQDSNYWSMVAMPPGRVPVTAKETDFAASVAALEQTGHPREARESYRALLKRWPTNLVGLIGLGNVEYGFKDLPASEQAFRRATETHPESAVGFNNLAHVLSEQGKLAEAEAAAKTAVSLGGPALSEAQKTLDAILAKSRPAAKSR